VMTSHLMMAIRDIHDVGGVTGRLALVLNEGVGGCVEIQANALIFWNGGVESCLIPRKSRSM